MIKTLSLVSSECSKENYMIPELPGKTDENSKDSYEGAEVLEPKPAIFLDDPVSVLDYSSLYPSSMIGSNISHDTIIKDKIYLGENGAKLLEEMGIQFEDISYDNYVSVIDGPMKADLDYDIFIDDSPLNVVKFLENNKKVILYSQPWNKHISNNKLFRISKLSESIKIIKNN